MGIVLPLLVDVKDPPIHWGPHAIAVCINGSLELKHKPQTPKPKILCFQAVSPNPSNIHRLNPEAFTPKPYMKF